VHTSLDYYDELENEEYYDYDDEIPESKEEFKEKLK